MSDVIIWLDIETTGLNHEVDKILEVSINIRDYYTDEFLRTATFLVKNEELPTMNQIVNDMHTVSGLFNDLGKAVLYHFEIDRVLASMISAYEGKRLLAGSSIHFDKDFIRKYMPEFFSLVHYRMIDISSMKEALKTMGVELEAEEQEPKHRAWTDVNSSFNWYMKWKESWQK